MKIRISPIHRSCCFGFLFYQRPKPGDGTGRNSHALVWSGLVWSGLTWSGLVLISFCISFLRSTLLYSTESWGIRRRDRGREREIYNQLLVSPSRPHIYSYHITALNHESTKLLSTSFKIHMDNLHIHPPPAGEKKEISMIGLVREEYVLLMMMIFYVFFSENIYHSL